MPVCERCAVPIPRTPRHDVRERKGGGDYLSYFGFVLCGGVVVAMLSYRSLFLCIRVGGSVPGREVQKGGMA